MSPVPIKAMTWAKNKCRYVVSYNTSSILGTPYLEPNFYAIQVPDEA